MKCSICGKKGKYMIRKDGMDLLDKGEAFKDITGDICSECLIKKNGIKRLYHLSLDHYVHKLTPRIPSSRAAVEDDQIMRVSTASTIEGALGAVPWGGTNLPEIMGYSGTPVIKVLEFDVNKVGYENIVPAEYLFQKDLVRDAYEHDECWITKTVEPDNCYFMVVTDYDEGFVDQYSYDDLVAYMNNEIEFSDILDGGVTTIENLKCFTFTGNMQIVYDFHVDLTVKAKEGNIASVDGLKSILREVLDTAVTDAYFNGDIEKNEDRTITVEGYIDASSFYFHHDHVLMSIIKELEWQFDIMKSPEFFDEGGLIWESSNIATTA